VEDGFNRFPIKPASQTGKLFTACRFGFFTLTTKTRQKISEEKMKEWKKLSKNRRTLLNELVEKHNYFKNAYFWGGRQKRNQLHEKTELNFYYKGNNYSITQTVSQSTRNTYYRLRVYVNGIKKDIRSIKKILEVI
jgi:hypothetical protein